MNKKCGFIQTDTIRQSLTKVFVSSPPQKFHFQRVILQEIIKSFFISQTILMYCTLKNPIAGIANSSYNHRIKCISAALLFCIFCFYLVIFGVS